MKTKLTVMLLLLWSSGNAQKKLFTDCRSSASYFARKGEVITFGCDSIMLLNPSAYHILDSAYHRLYAVSINTSREADTLVNYYRIAYQMKSDQLAEWQRSFIELRDSTIMQTNHLSKELQLVNDNLLMSKTKLHQADSLTAGSIQMIKQMARNQRAQKVKSGLIGFTLGALAITLLKSL